MQYLAFLILSRLMSGEGGGVAGWLGKLKIEQRSEIVELDSVIGRPIHNLTVQIFYDMESSI